MRTIVAAAAAAAVLLAGSGCGATHAAAPPAACTASANQRLAALVAERHDGPVDNVMVCGITIGSSRAQRAGPHGGHQVLPLRVPLGPNATALVEVVTNDALDGRVTAPRGAAVFAYGQYFRPARGFDAGIHDTHCATHRGADNGWVIVDGVKYPQRGCGF